MYLVIHGIHTSCKSPVKYLEHIVYGHPRIEAVLVGSHLVGIVEFSEAQHAQAKYTFERLGTFPLGVCLTADVEVALREFGTWVRHYSPGVIAGLEDDSEACPCGRSHTRSEHGYVG